MTVCYSLVYKFLQYFIFFYLIFHKFSNLFVITLSPKKKIKFLEYLLNRAFIQQHRDADSHNYHRESVQQSVSRPPKPVPTASCSDLKYGRLQCSSFNAASRIYEPRSADQLRRVPTLGGGNIFNRGVTSGTPPFR